MKVTFALAFIAMCLARPAMAQNLEQAAAALDSARQSKSLRPAVLDNAAIIYAAALTQKAQGNSEGAQRLAEVAARLAHGAEHPPLEIGARIDSLPFAAIAAPPGVPQSALSLY